MTASSNQPFFHPPIWDRGEAIDEAMMRFTIGEDWRMDRQLVPFDIEGSLAHAAGLARCSLLNQEDYESIQTGLNQLLVDWQAGKWTVEPGDEDVHSAVERRLIDLIGKAGSRLHTGRSRNDQVATDLLLWLRAATQELTQGIRQVLVAGQQLHRRFEAWPLPGYTHLRRAMPSTVGDWISAHCRAFEDSLLDLNGQSHRWRLCPLGSGAGYGVPLELDRQGVAEDLGFQGPEPVVSYPQHSRGRAELSFLTVVEGVALNLGKLAADLWLFSTEEFGFLELPVSMTTGSSLMPHKRNPDLIELIRANSRQICADREALKSILSDLPSGYHRDFQLIKPPLFRSHSTAVNMLELIARFLDKVEFRKKALDLASKDVKLAATEKLLQQAAAGQAFREAYRRESREFESEPPHNQEEGSD
ncbi:MAG: argininosuccinate lyase [Planctomycetota bacterium]|nr:MAG: argininosuccinate lyase [Planctomycetota bacterium]